MQVLPITQRMVSTQYSNARPFERSAAPNSWHLSARLALAPAANDVFPTHTEVPARQLFGSTSSPDLGPRCGLRWSRGVLGLVFR
jgi:hypothetical protein